ncbi:MAG: signal recognition particle [Erysipelothrix sp.]|nr:signal recognition particle [Erysipelothrix sp.]
MSFEKALRLNRLFDLYSSLLTPRQKEVFQYYYHEDFSYQEIADLLSISRAAAHDNVSKTTKALEDYEENLRLDQLIAELDGLNESKVNAILNNYKSGGNYE